MLNVLDGKSNGEQKDRAWAWKTNAEQRSARGDRAPQRELRDLDEPSAPQAKI